MNTGSVLDELGRNRVQSNIKAVFFVQTRNTGGGASRQGRTLLQREHAEGHVLGLHTGTARGHVSHTSMSLPELHRSLEDGMADICAITGARAARAMTTGTEAVSSALFRGRLLRAILTQRNSTKIADQAEEGTAVGAGIPLGGALLPAASATGHRVVFVELGHGR